MTLLPTKHGDFTIKIVSGEHVVLTKDYEGVPLVRIHSECLTGDALGSTRCDCQEQLNNALKMIGAKGGIFIYLRQEGRGIGLANKIRAYQLQDEGMDTVEANEHLGLPVDAREYGIVLDVLKEAGIKEVKLLTNNPEKIRFLESAGMVVHRIPLVIQCKENNKKYLATKKEKLNHLL